MGKAGKQMVLGEAREDESEQGGIDGTRFNQDKRGPWPWAPCFRETCFFQPSSSFSTSHRPKIL